MEEVTNTREPSSEEIRPQDRRAALIALAIQPPAAAGPCPSPEELAAFSDGRLAPQDRARLLQHLDACPVCFQEWLAVNSARATLPESTVTGTSYLRRRIASWHPPWQQIRWWWSGIGLVLAASLLIVWMWWPRLTESTLAVQIAQTYREVLPVVSGERTADLAARPLPWENASAAYGVSAEGAGGPAARAFGAGLWIGRETLRSRNLQTVPTLPPGLAPATAQDSWEKTEWAPYVLLGRWLFLLQIACSTPQAIPVPLWEQQPAIARALQSAFRERPPAEAEAQAALTAVTDIAADFERQQEGDSRLRVCAQIERGISNLAARLAPPGS